MQVVTNIKMFLNCTYEKFNLRVEISDKHKANRGLLPLMFFGYWAIISINIFVLYNCASAFPEEPQYAPVPKNIEGINNFNEKGNTALIEAVLSSQVEAIRSYISAGADVNAANQDGGDVLHHSCIWYQQNL